ncbi:MAG: CRISPR-associated endonuclease Cas2 [Roseiflexaceae bacterium]
MFYIICYDITEPKRLQRIAKILEGHGQRVQYSVFECDLTDRQYRELRRRLGRVVQVSEGDSLRFYQLCAPCSQSVEVVGQGPPPEKSDNVYII